MEWINLQLEHDLDVKHKLPIEEEGEDLFRAVEDGIIFCKLVNILMAGTVHKVKTINKGKLNQLTMHENQTVAIDSASQKGFDLHNIMPQDLIEGQPHSVISLLWKLFKADLLKKLKFEGNPGIEHFLEGYERLIEVPCFSKEVLLLHLLNYHLIHSGSKRRVRNFSKDIKGSECYTVLLNQIVPDELGLDMSPMNESELEMRATLMLQKADKMGCRKFVWPKNVVEGNARLNLAFVANLFDTSPALKLPTESDFGDDPEFHEEYEPDDFDWEHYDSSSDDDRYGRQIWQT